MQDPEIIADQLDNIIRPMVINCRSLSPQVSNYLVFLNHKKEIPTWIVLIFFSDDAQLEEAIKSGVCYQIHQYLWNTLMQREDTKHLIKAIFFESGVVPTEEISIHLILNAAFEKLDRISIKTPEENPVICKTCGHDFKKHQMAGIPDEASQVPLEGWIMCPEEHCHCFATWNLNPPTPAQS